MTTPGTSGIYAQAEVAKPPAPHPAVRAPRPVPAPAKASDKPKLMAADDLTRTGNKLTGLGESAELAKALFEQL
jgi:hypothetical protein